MTFRAHRLRRRPADRIAGRTIVISGGARGIGFATAKALLSRGAVVVIGDRDVTRLNAATAELALAGGVSGHPLDVTDPASFGAFMNQARLDGNGRIDVLINNAGVMPIGPFLDQSDESIRTSIDVNFGGVLTGCRLALPEMVSQGAGHIVNVASLAGMVAVPGQAVYAGTKFAVVGLSTALGDEFASRGIDVSVVMPPFTNTEMISGTSSVLAHKPVEPEVIAAAIVRVLDTPKTHVSVPSGLRVVLTLTNLLGPRTRRWLTRQSGSDRVFLEFDANARRAYEDRAQSAVGVLTPLIETSIDATTVANVTKGTTP